MSPLNQIAHSSFCPLSAGSFFSLLTGGSSCAFLYGLPGESGAEPSLTHDTQMSKSTQLFLCILWFLNHTKFFLTLFLWRYSFGMLRVHPPIFSSKICMSCCLHFKPYAAKVSVWRKASFPRCRASSFVYPSGECTRVCFWAPSSARMTNLSMC